MTLPANTDIASADALPTPPISYYGADYHRRIVERMAALGAHLVRLDPDAKKPTENGWADAAGMPVEAAIAHTGGGGNIGVHTGFSKIVILDAENLAATTALRAAGFEPTVITANSQIEGSPKRGGSHVWLRVPDGIVLASLSTVGRITLPNGGKMEVLAGRRHAVAPPSALGDFEYELVVGGVLDFKLPLREIPVAPAWLFSLEVECPPGLEPLLGVLSPTAAYDRATATGETLELSEKIDDIPWDQWISGDLRLSATGLVDGCGCPVWHWQGGDHEKSATLHDGCGQGNGAHLWSDTMMAALGLGDHVSRLDFSAKLRGVSRAEAAKAVGIELGERHAFANIDLDGFEESAVKFEAEDKPEAAARARSAASILRTARHLHLVQNGETFTDQRVIGGVDPTPIVVPGTVDVIEDDGVVHQGEIVDEGAWEDGDAAMWNRNREIESLLRGDRDPATGLWQGMVPCLGRIANIAESRGIYMLGLTEAVLPRVSARVPANVLLTPRAEGIREKAEGVGLGYNSILLGPPATGKTTTQTAAAGAVPLPEGIVQCPTGSAEGVMKKARSFGSGKDTEMTVHSTSVYVETDEIKSQTKDLTRDGSVYAAFVNSAFFGGTMTGATASERARNATIPGHSTRFAQQLGAQPQLCGPILAESGSGLTARFAFAFTGSVGVEDLGLLYGRAVPALLPAGLPWDPPIGIPFGYVKYRGDGSELKESDETPTVQIDCIEALPAEWIVIPRDPAEVAAARTESARRSRHTRVALTEDRESGRTSGHDFVRIEKTAALLAFMDGLKQPTQLHVAAAKLLAEATALAAEEAKVQSDSEDDAKAKLKGRGRGIEYATGNAVAKQEATDAVAAAAEALYAKLTRPADGVMVKGKLAKGFGGSTTLAALTAASAMRPEHRPHKQDAVNLLAQQGRISVDATGRVTAVQRALAAG